jgi:hypothetical protein
MSKQRAKGTRREKGFLPLLRRVWPDTKRAGTTMGPHDEGDYLNTGDWKVECKHQKTLCIPEWVRIVAAKGDQSAPWLILARTDKRTFPYDLAIMEAELAITLLEAVKEKLVPFAGYKDFAECVAKNQGKKDPEAYCAKIMRAVELGTITAKEGRKDGVRP